jgi:hypothetical protein
VKPRPPTDAIRKRVRPFLPIIIRRVAAEGRAPRDYFMVMGKYETDSGMLFPRSEAPELLKVARTPVQGEKLERFLSEPCEEKKLLVMVTARDFVEAYFVPVPTVAREPGAKTYVTQAEMNVVNRYLNRHAASMYAGVKREGGRAGDYVVIALISNNDPPIVLRRELARDALELSKFGDVVKELDVPAADDELLVVYKIGSVPSWSRLNVRSAANNNTSRG